MKVKVYSFDWDGCLANKNVHELLEKIENHTIKDEYSAVLNANKELLSSLAECDKHYDERYFYCGSSRQDAESEFSNSSSNNISCFSHLELLANELSASFNKLLLSDLYNDSDSGDNLDLSKKLLVKNGVDNSGKLRASDFKDTSKFQIDTTKLSILYAQIHDIASMYPNEEIEFDFFDDRDDILKALSSFFEKYKSTIPLNICLNLFHYAGEHLALNLKLQGKGPTDFNYTTTIKQLSNSYSVQLLENPDFISHLEPAHSESLPLFLHDHYLKAQRQFKDISGDDINQYYEAFRKLQALKYEFLSNKRITNFFVSHGFSVRKEMLKSISDCLQLSKTNCALGMDDFRVYCNKLPKSQSAGSTKDSMVKAMKTIAGTIPVKEKSVNSLKNNINSLVK